LLGGESFVRANKRSASTIAPRSSHANKHIAQFSRRPHQFRVAAGKAMTFRVKDSFGRDDLMARPTAN
jgi:hypothetical protein